MHSCLACLVNKPDYTRNSPLGVFLIDRPGKTLFFDLIEKLPGEKHILVIVDLFSKYVDTFILKSNRRKSRIFFRT